ncbi:hypothetical protein PILCRDRAFT_825517 [Piloderma croceum F 1598]|uniref:Uncharacterized protein n=1 Tax=Piloderma croceum (strain F 1598) TaxID=765440 RepID=A0A0C3EXC6_PILCF|nr:hypothetical protein PILCRDRAFT_825517 [Piloderma croceum F 1598]
MRKRNTAGKLNLPLVIPSTLIFMFATVNVIGLWIHMYTTFVVNADNPEAYLDLIRSPQKTIIQTGQVGAILLADALMVYRTFILWNRNIYVIITPCLTFIATFTSAVLFIELQQQVDLETSVFAKALTEWTAAFLLSSLATTVHSTTLIAYKLMNTQLGLRQDGVSTAGSRAALSHRIARIIVESAALCSLNHILYVILYETKNQVESTPSFLEASIASITCSLITVRSEEAINHLQTLPTSIGNYPSTASAKLLPLRKCSVGEVVDIRPSEADVKVYDIRPMEVNVGDPSGGQV